MSAATDRSIKTILNELEFLNEEGIVTKEEYDTICDLLADKTRQAKRKQSEASTVSSIAPPITVSRPTQPTTSARILEAKYEFAATESTDLSLKPGMRIELLEELNNDWWRGRAQDTGAEGIFPSNYVVEVPKPAVDEKQVYEHRNSSTASSYYKPPPAPNYYGQQNQSSQSQSSHDPQPFDPNTNYSPNGSTPSFYGQQPQMVVVQQEQQHESRASNGAKRFGKRFGEAAIFGAGATVGADIINGIF